MIDRFDVMVFVMGISFIVLGIAFITMINFWYILGFATLLLIVAGGVFVVFGILMLLLLVCNIVIWYQKKYKNPTIR